MFSKQNFYCRACGCLMHVTTNASYGSEVCSDKCWDELQWLVTLSIMNKPYQSRVISIETKEKELNAIPIK